MFPVLLLVVLKMGLRGADAYMQMHCQSPVLVPAFHVKEDESRVPILRSDPYFASNRPFTTPPNWSPVVMLIELRRLET